MLLWIKYMAADDMDMAMGTWNSKLRLSQKKNAKHVHEITEKLGENHLKQWGSKHENG